MAGTSQLIDVIGRLVRHFKDSGQLPVGMAESLSWDLDRYSRTGTSEAAGDQNALAAIVETLAPRINEGLRCYATRPTSDSVYVDPGSGYSKGQIYHLASRTTVPIPITEQPNAQVWWVVLTGNEQILVKRTRDIFQDVVIAKIIAGHTDVAVIRDNAPENVDDHDAYLISGRDIMLQPNVEFDDASIEAIQNVTDRVRASALIGDLVVSEQLKILSSDGSIRFTDAMRIYDPDDNLLMILSRDGLYFYTASGAPLARFTGEEGASRVGGIRVTPEGDLQILNGQALRDAEGNVIINEGGIVNGDDITMAYVPVYYTRDSSIPEADSDTDLAAHLAGISNQFERTKLTGLKSGIGADVMQWNWTNPVYAIIYVSRKIHKVVKNPATARVRISKIDTANAAIGDTIDLIFESGYNWTLEYEASGNILPMGDSNAAGNVWKWNVNSAVARLQWDGTWWQQTGMGPGTLHEQRINGTYSIIASQSVTQRAEVVNVGANDLVGRNGAGAIDGQAPATVRSMLNVTQDGEGLLLNQVTKTAAYTMTATDFTVWCDTDTAGAGITITLPAAASHAGRLYAVKNTGTTGYSVTVAGSGGDLPLTIPDGDSRTVQSDGSNWWVI